MNKTVKLITAITGLLVAIGTLVGAITVTFGRGDDSAKYSYTTIITFVCHIYTNYSFAFYLYSNSTRSNLNIIIRKLCAPQCSVCVCVPS